MASRFSAKLVRNAVISIALTVLLVVFLAKQLEGDVLSALRQASLGGVLIAAAAYVLCYLFRAWRFQILLRGKAQLRDLVGVVAIHNLFTNLLPFRSGELSYPYLMSKRGIGAGEGIATLVLARIADFLIISGAFLIALTFLPELPSLIESAVIGTWILMGVLFALALTALFASGPAVRLLQRFTPKFFKHSAVGKWIWQKLREVDTAMRALRGPALIQILLSSAGIWLFQFLTYAALLNGIALPISFAAVIVTVAVISLASAIPIQGFAGIGTNEAYWTAVLMALGISKELAIPAAFAQHFVIISFYAVLGVAGLLVERWHGGK